MPVKAATTDRDPTVDTRFNVRLKSFFASREKHNTTQEKRLKKSCNFHAETDEIKRETRNNKKAFRLSFHALDYLAPAALVFNLKEKKRRNREDEKQMDGGNVG